MTTIDLNSDVGESFGRWTLGDDQAMFRSVSSANVACGFHAGDPSVIRRTCREAAAAGVVVVVGTILVATFALRTISSLFDEEAMAR